MIWVYKYNDEFIWQAGEEIMFDEEFDEVIPDGYTEIQPPDGLYIAKYDPDKKEWYEAASKEYIDSLQPDPLPPDDVTFLKKQVAMLTLQVAQLQRGGSS